MSEKQIEKELKELKFTIHSMKDEIDIIKERFDDVYLTKFEKKHLIETFKMEKESKLLSKKDVFE